MLTSSDIELHSCAITMSLPCAVWAAGNRRPGWWDDPLAAQRRQKVIDDFQHADLAMAIAELEMYVHQPRIPDGEVASVIRRQWAVRWLAEVGRAKLSSLQHDQMAYWVLHWQQQTADHLGSIAWARTMELPASVVEEGVRNALELVRESEHLGTTAEGL